VEGRIHPPGLWVALGSAPAPGAANRAIVVELLHFFISNHGKL